MSMPSRPWMKFNPTAWRADPLLRSCEPLSRYVWLEMIGLMHEAIPYGHLIFAGQIMTPARLARIIGMDSADVVAAIADLELNQVFSRNSEGVIFSRKMVRDEEYHQKSSRFGRKGVAAKELKAKEKEASLEGGQEGGHEGTRQLRVKSIELREEEDPPLIPLVENDPPDPGDGKNKSKGNSGIKSKPKPAGKKDAGKLEKGPLPLDWSPLEFSPDSLSGGIVASWTPAQLAMQADLFRAHHRKVGSEYIDWQATWSTWVLNSQRFAERDQIRGGPGGGASGSGKKDFADIVLAEAAARKAMAGGAG